MTEARWNAVRREFPVLDTHAYLNTGSYGPVPRRALQSLEEVAREEVERGRASREYYDRLEAVREALRASLAALVGSRTADIALTGSTTTGCHIVMSGLRLRPGDEIVTTSCEHHSLLTAARATGATVRLANVSGSGLERAAERIEAEVNARTRLIALSHVTWSEGRLLPIAALRSLRLPVLVDGAQSVGAIPVDVEALGCDFLAMPGQKWLLGPDATGGLYVHERWHERLDVALPSFFGHEPNRGAAVDTPLPDAARFQSSPVPLCILQALGASLGLHEELGAARFERARHMTERFRAALEERYEVITPPGQGTLITFVAPGDPEALASRLAAERVVVRTIPGTGWLRVSVGFWTAEEELERLLDALARR